MQDAGASENLETRPVAPRRLGLVAPRQDWAMFAGGPSSGALMGHCHDRNRSFDLSPFLAALVRTQSQPR
jgi:hypothetical protein